MSFSPWTSGLQALWTLWKEKGGSKELAQCRKWKTSSLQIFNNNWNSTKVSRHTYFHSYLKITNCNRSSIISHQVTNIRILLSNIIICALLMNIHYYTIHFSTNLCNTKSILTNHSKGYNISDSNIYNERKYNQPITSIYQAVVMKHFG